MFPGPGPGTGVLEASMKEEGVGSAMGLPPLAPENGTSPTLEGKLVIFSKNSGPFPLSRQKSKKETHFCG